MKNKHIISVFAIAIVAIIAGFFLLDIPKIALYFWAFSALLFSLLLSLALLITFNQLKDKRDGVFYGASLSTSTFIYLAAVVISLFFSKGFEDNVNGFIFLQLAINALFIIVLIIIAAVVRHIYQKTVITAEKLQNGEYNKPKRGGF